MGSQDASDAPANVFGLLVGRPKMLLQNGGVGRGAVKSWLLAIHDKAANGPDYLADDSSRLYPTNL
jgi:hypothetical protein